MKPIDASTEAGRWLALTSRDYMKHPVPGQVRTLGGKPVVAWFAKTRLLLNDGIIVAIQSHSFHAHIWNMDLFVHAFMKDDE